MKVRSVAARLAILIALFRGGAYAQETPVHWALEPVAEVSAGRSAILGVRAVMDSGWHIYGMTQPRPPIALTFDFEGDAALTMGKPREPKPIKKLDEAFGIPTLYFEHAVTYRVPINVKAGTSPGVRKGSLFVQYQACTARVCLPPRTETIEFQIRVVPASLREGAASDSLNAGAAPTFPIAPSQQSVAPAPTPAEPSASAPDPGSRTPGTVSARPNAGISSTATAAAEKSLPSYILFAALMGLLALTTPCVFPMIPITVSYFTRRGSNAAVVDAAVYGGGIVAAFTGLGLLLAVIYGATGISRFAANPWVNLLVAALFIAFALDLLGAWELRMPWQVVSRVNATRRSGRAGILLMGVAFAVTTFTCTVPFVGTLLVSAASGRWTRPILGMLAFSTVFASPFILLAVFPSKLHALPKSGQWMHSFKTMLGLIELGAAMKFLSNADLVWQLGILHRPVVIVVWAMLAMFGAFFLFGLVRIPTDTPPVAMSVAGSAPKSGEIPAPQSRGLLPGRLVAGAVFAGLAAFLLLGLTKRSVGPFDAFLPPHVYPGTEHVADGAEVANGVWLTSYADASAAAAASGRNMFVDFTGYTCTNCRWMESNVFNRPEIKARFDRYVLLRLYTDGRGAQYAANQKLQLDRFETVALPFYAVIAPDGTVAATFPGLTRDAAEFAAFLDKGI